ETLSSITPAARQAASRTVIMVGPPEKGRVCVFLARGATDCFFPRLDDDAANGPNAGLKGDPPHGNFAEELPARRRARRRRSRPVEEVGRRGGEGCSAGSEGPARAAAADRRPLPGAQVDRLRQQEDDGDPAAEEAAQV